MNMTVSSNLAIRERLNRMGLLTEPAGYVDGQNLYEYVTGDPVNALDPFGLAKLTVGGLSWRPPSVSDAGHPHVPRKDTAGTGVPIDTDLGRHSHSTNGRYKWFPDHNVILDTKTACYEKAPSSYPDEFRKQLQNKTKGVRVKWALGLATIASIASTTQADADDITRQVERIERDIRNGKYGSPDTEGLVAGLANSLGNMFGMDDTIAYAIISDHFQDVAYTEE
jgi:hypothetical protein